MQYKICLNNLVFFFNILFLFYSTNIFALENKIIIKVENEIITSLDIEFESKYLEALNPNIKNLPDEKVKLIAKNSLIKEKIKKNEILKYIEKIELDQKFLEKLIQDRYSILNLNSKNEFLNYLDNFNIDLNTVEKKISIEGLWNQLIYQKYSSKVKINKNKLEDQIEKSFNQGEKNYFLSEIVFNIDDKNKLESKYTEIKNSISKDGFENAALSYSISNSAELGGKLGWISENTLNKLIIEGIKNLEKNNISKPIFTPNGYIILKIDDIKFSEKKFDKKKELNNLIRIETNKQLNQYSNIFFNKVKKNTNINEL